MYKSKSKTSGSRTIKNDTAMDLNNILKEAENITLDSLDFNKTFREQGKILCNIKYMLFKNKNSSNNDNKPFTCNPIISSKLNDTKFNELFQKIKNKNNLASGKITTSSRMKIKSSKKQRHSNIALRVSSVKSKSNKDSKPGKHSKTKLNNRYPIVIIRKRTPRKNVIYLNK